MRRVPLTVAALDTRTFARQSTKIRVADDPRAIRAGKIAAKFNEDTERYWRALLDEQADEAQKRYAAARARARSFGFDYLQADDVANLRIAEIRERVRTAKAQPEHLTDLTANRFRA